VLVGTTSIWLSKDNRDSRGMRTPSVKCKTVITAVLMVMSGMDPHMISGTWDVFLVKSWLGCIEVGLLGCGSVTVRLRDVIKVVTAEETSLVSCLLD
jgi:hypothetical protein